MFIFQIKTSAVCFQNFTRCCYQIQYKNQNMPKLFDWIKIFDLFGSSILLRYQKQYTHHTFLSSFCSLALIIFCVVIFITKFIQVLHKTEINVIQTTSQDIFPAYYNLTKFLFAFTLDKLNISASPRYFDMKFQAISTQGNSKLIKNLSLIPCTYEQFASFGKDFEILYNGSNFNTYLCNQPDQTMEMEGRYGSNFKYIQILINKCTGDDCAKPEEINTFFSTNKYAELDFYFTDTTLNPYKANPIQYTFNTDNYFVLTGNQTISADLFYSDFKVTTDDSLLPIVENRQQKGIYVDGHPLINILPLTNDCYLKIHLRKSSKKLTVTRTHPKYDSLFSYVGGLFGVATMIVKFFVSYYNLCSYQITLANDMFIYRSYQQEKQLKHQYYKTIAQRKKVEALIEQQDHKKIAIQNFNPFTFLNYYLYEILKRLGFDSLNWKHIEPYYASLKQIRKQTDLGFFLKRFVHLNRALEILFDHDQKLLMHIYKPENILHLKKQRKKYYLQDNLKYHFENNPDQKNQDNEFVKTYEKKIEKAYANLLYKGNPIAQKIIANIDPQIQQKFCKKHLNEYLSKKTSLDKFRMQGDEEIELGTMNIIESERNLVKILPKINKK